MISTSINNVIHEGEVHSIHETRTSNLNIIDRVYLRFTTILGLKRSSFYLTLVLLFFFSLVSSISVQSQSYGGTTIFGDMDQYAFNWTIVCAPDGTSAVVTADFTAPPPALSPQIHLGGGVFVNMVGPNPFTYTITGLTDCEFNFQFWMAYEAALYSSPFYTPATLPVVLSNFTAKKGEDQTVVLTWDTSTEINSDYFIVERSNDGNNWQRLDKVDAAGDSNELLSYAYRDSKLPLVNFDNNTVYYRLKVVDLDGSFEYSDFVSVRFTENQNDLIEVYPNPTLDNIFVNLDKVDVKVGSVEISLFNNLGQRVLYNLTKTNQILGLDVSDLPSSTYVLMLKQNGQLIQQQRVVKK